MSESNSKVALITGASSGIGRATAKLFAENGIRVVVAARRREELANLVTEIESNGGTATAVKTDVSKASEVEHMVAHALETYGRLDFAVNNAGIEGQLRGITDLSEEDWDTVMNINLKGIFLSMKYEARSMIKQGTGGAIVNVGSVNSFLGFPTGSAYVTSKHGLVGLTTSVSAELAAQGIRVNLLCPGVIETPMHQRLRGVVGDDIYDKGLLPKVHMQRAGKPEEIAQSIFFLCSDAASYITGTTLTPDGGLTMTL
jgi:NAD(P)-dependent dehydrogenase (short-subunit alcohol dehydrogenase family)